MGIDKKLIDKLLAGYRGPEDLQAGRDGTDLRRAGPEAPSSRSPASESFGCDDRSGRGLSDAGGAAHPRPQSGSVPGPEDLVHDKRNRDKRAKDVLYVHDTIETFGGNLASLREQWETSVRPALHANAVRIIEHAAEIYFGGIDDTIRDSARIATGRNLTPEMVRELCAYGWARSFHEKATRCLAWGKPPSTEVDMRDYKFLFDNDSHAAARFFRG